MRHLNRLGLGIGAGACAAAILAMFAVPATAQDGGVRAAPWYLKFSHQDLDTITVPFKDGSSQTYYYMTFTLQNTGKVDAHCAFQVRADISASGRSKGRLIALPASVPEEVIRRIANVPDLKNVQQINQMKVIKPGTTVHGIAVFGSFDREWDTAHVTVSGVEPRVLHCRVRKYANGFVVPHRAYGVHNAGVKAKAGKDDVGKDAYVVLAHDVVWGMHYTRAGDEFAPHLDNINRVREGWEVSDNPAPKIVLTKTAVFGGG